MEYGIEYKNVSLELDNKTILKDINLRIKYGEIFVLLGKNGSGKTILLKTAAGLFPPDSGNVKLFSKDIYSESELNSLEFKKQMGYVFQKSGLFDSLTIAENVIFALKRFGDYSEDELMQKAMELLNSTGLSNVENKYPSELSGGMQKRAGIARAIAVDPKLLLMDDPTAGLDPILSDAIANLILDIHTRLNSTMIVVTHDLKIAEKIGNRIGLMHEGKLVSVVETEELYNSNDPYLYQYRNNLLEGPISVL